MPNINGNIYPEIESAGLLNHRFKILIDIKEGSRELTSFIMELYTLKEYLNDVIDSSAQLEIFTNSMVPKNYPQWTDIKPVILEEEISNSKEGIWFFRKKVENYQ
jgi:hypothetical protein